MALTGLHDIELSLASLRFNLTLVFMAPDDKVYEVINETLWNEIGGRTVNVVLVQHKHVVPFIFVLAGTVHAHL